MLNGLFYKLNFFKKDTKFFIALIFIFLIGSTIIVNAVSKNLVFDPLIFINTWVPTILIGLFPLTLSLYLRDQEDKNKYLDEFVKHCRPLGDLIRFVSLALPNNDKLTNHEDAEYYIYKYFLKMKENEEGSGYLYIDIYKFFLCEKIEDLEKLLYQEIKKFFEIEENKKNSWADLQYYLGPVFHSFIKEIFIADNIVTNNLKEKDVKKNEEYLRVFEMLFKYKFIIDKIKLK